MTSGKLWAETGIPAYSSNVSVEVRRKRIAYRFAIAIAFLPVPVLAGLPPVLLDFPPAAANGWYLLTVPVGAAITIGLVTGLLRPAARAWFNEA